MIWTHIPKNGNANILVMDGQMMNKEDGRFVLETPSNGNNLVISLAEVKDEGEYICKVSALNPVEIKHTVQIRGM